VSETASGAAAALRPLEAPADLLARYQWQLAVRGFHSDPAQLQAVAQLENLRRRLLAASASKLPRWLQALRRGTHHPRTEGIYLWGSVGRGKTWLMDLFCASLPAGLARRRHFHRFMYEVHQQLAVLRGRRAPLETVAEGIARAARVLCFDELYVADIADAMILGGLFAGLLHRGVTLVATSNVPPADLYRDGLQRVRFLPAIELLQQQLAVIHVDGPTDYRLRELTQAGTYLPSAAPETPARLQALFERLADHGRQSGGSIEIDGRQIAVVRAAPAVVWFEFAALCAGPRSTNDYIEIAREYQSLIVADVPVFDAEHDDEARRFIALVDELYDRSVNLVVSAAAPPAQLYRGERLAALFQRTASRLVEMQSEQYLARAHRA
jgi:cell division protein ZapE